VPPTNINGAQPRQTNDIFQLNENDIIIPTMNPKTASIKIAIVSVVNPFNFDISSDKILLSTPGALSLLSNQARLLYTIPSKSYFLKVKVKFSPT
jgi:hypothetical protein